MLTQSEREWLEHREPILEKYGCYSLKFYRMREDDFGYIGDLFDAAEFSERVAAKLASYVGECPFEEGTYENCMKTGCVACQLRDARIEVEEEMDATRR